MTLASLAPAMKQIALDGITSRPVISRIHPGGIFCLWLGCVLTAIGAGFLLFAELIWLQKAYEPEVAAMLVALTAVVVASLSAATGVAIFRRPPTHQNALQNADLAKSVSALIDSLTEELEEPIRDNPKTALMVASLAGFLVGDHVRH